MRIKEATDYFKREVAEYLDATDKRYYSAAVAEGELALPAGFDALLACSKLTRSRYYRAEHLVDAWLYHCHAGAPHKDNSPPPGSVAAFVAVVKHNRRIAADIVASYEQGAPPEDLERWRAYANKARPHIAELDELLAQVAEIDGGAANEHYKADT